MFGVFTRQHWIFFFFFFFFFFGCTQGMWKFLGQWLNLCHNSDPSHCNDSNSLICYATRELPFNISSFFFPLFLRPHLQHMEIPRLGVELELQRPAYTTATVMPDMSHVWHLNCNSRQHQILNLMSEAKGQTCILINTNQVCYSLATMGTPKIQIIPDIDWQYIWFRLL